MSEYWLFFVIAFVAGCFVPKMIVRSGNKIPDFLNPCQSAAPAQLRSIADVVGQDPAPAYKATVASRRPLVECYDWFVQAGSGLIEPTSGDLRLARAIKPHLDNLVSGKVPGPSVDDLK